MVPRQRGGVAHEPRRRVGPALIHAEHFVAEGDRSFGTVARGPEMHDERSGGVADATGRKSRTVKRRFADVHFGQSSVEKRVRAQYVRETVAGRDPDRAVGVAADAILIHVVPDEA